MYLKVAAVLSLFLLMLAPLHAEHQQRSINILIIESMTLADVQAWADIAGGDVDPVIEADDAEFLSAAADLLPAEPWTIETWGPWTKAVKAATGRKGKGLFMPLRKALTGLDHGPELKAYLPLIGRTRAQQRLKGERG